MKTKLTAFTQWMETGYYKKNSQIVWDLYLQLIRYWGCMSKEEKLFMDKSKKTLLIGK
jgi:hypothetical protein